MVLIFSEDNDHSTNMVLDWLIRKNVDFIRVNKGDVLNLKCIITNDNSEEIHFYYKNRLINSADITSVWFRRGGVHLKTNVTVGTIDVLIQNQIAKHLSEEKEEIEEFINTTLERKICLGSKFRNNVNKLKSLQMAKQAGLSIPKTWITEEMSYLRHLFNEELGIITKSVSNGPIINSNGMIYGNYTEQIVSNDIGKLDSNFFASLFQEKIEKDFELRIFYLNKKLYSMAIFSQLDKQTSVDFRKYNKDNPNRTVPYKLPDLISLRIVNFMDLMCLNTGSIDMIVDKSGKFIFLEVNPVGQFAMVSHPCNYYLEREIADFLTDYSEKND